MALAGTIAAAALLTGVTGAGAAERLVASEVREFMYGTRMSGVLVDTNERWFECVAPSGDTVYNIEGRISTGFVEVDEAGIACFTYPRLNDTSTSCFNVEREDGKPVFVEVGSGVRFRVDRTDPSFDLCPTSIPVS